MKISTRIIICLMLFFSTASYAQNDKFAIGISGGPSLINMYGNLSKYWHSIENGANGTLDTWPWVGGSAEFSFQYKINKIFSIQTGLSYEREGFLFERLQSGFGKQHITFDYVTIPLLARAELGRKIKFTVCAGPYISAPLDAGMQVGFGMIVPINKRFEFSLEDRNSVGLYGIKYIFDPETPALRNITVALMAGFSYKFGKRAARVGKEGK
jgi:hypothetical protein